MISKFGMIASVTAVAAAFTIGLSIGWKFIGWPQGFAAGQEALKAHYEALHKVAVTTMRDKQQCAQQVDKVNEEVVKQREENRTILVQDRQATKIAIEKFEKASERAAATAQKTQINISEARNELVKIKDACLSAGVPADYFSLLNRALGADTAPALASDSAMPGSAPDSGSQLQSAAAPMR